VTLTGAGEHTDFGRMRELSNAFSFVEWGVLYSPERAGQENRYPSLSWIDAFAQQASEQGMNIALHLCGQAAKDLLTVASSDTPYAHAPGRALLELAQSFGRVQVNTRAKCADATRWQRAVEVLGSCEQRTRLLMQYNEANAEVCERLRRVEGFEVLVDSSGGRGVEREDWHVERLADMRRLGFAGGLGHHNLERQLPRIEQAAGPRVFSIDMEGRVRNELDELDLRLCETVLHIAQSFISTQWVRDGALHEGPPREVAKLDGLWLDWWVGAARGHELVMPPRDASAAVGLYRPTGKFESYRPSENHHQAVRLLQQERVALTPTDEHSWRAQALGSPLVMQDEDMVVAGMRAIVAKHFGPEVPRNPTRLVRA
jgi:hypothetical protein